MIGYKKFKNEKQVIDFVNKENAKLISVCQNNKVFMVFYGIRIKVVKKPKLVKKAKKKRR